MLSCCPVSYSATARSTSFLFFPPSSSTFFLICCISAGELLFSSILVHALCLQKWQILLLDWCSESWQCVYHFICLVTASVMLQCGWTPWSILFFCNIDTVCIVSYSSSSASFSLSLFFFFFFLSFFSSSFFPTFSHLLLQCWWTISIFSSALCSLQNWQVLLLGCYYQSCKCLYHFIYLVQLQPMLCCGDEDFCGQFEFLPISFLLKVLSDIFSSGCVFCCCFFLLFLLSFVLISCFCAGALFPFWIVHYATCKNGTFCCWTGTMNLVSVYTLFLTQYIVIANWWCDGSSCTGCVD